MNERNQLPDKIDWNQVKLLELDQTKVHVLLSDGGKVSLEYSSSEDLQGILQHFGRPPENLQIP